MIERITMLTSPPVVGRRYLVPTVDFPWLSYHTPRPWPVFLPKHDDVEFLNFKWQHYHVAPRFLRAREVAAARDYYSEYSGDEFFVAQAQPLQRITSNPELRAEDGGRRHPPVVWRLRTCSVAEIPYRHGDKESIKAMGRHFSGRQCHKAKVGWICPHRRFPLGSIAPVDGVITCPLHGLRIAADTGKCL